MRPRAPGVTLVELLVVLILIGLAASVVGLTLGSATRSISSRSQREDVTAARDSAIRTGRPLTVWIHGNTVKSEITALPDGRVIADTVLPIDRLSGDTDDTR